MVKKASKKQSSPVLSGFLLLQVACFVFTCCLAALSDAKSHHQTHQSDYHNHEPKLRRHRVRNTFTDGLESTHEQQSRNNYQPYQKAFYQSAPGLYDLDEIVRPLQGQADFERYVIHGDQVGNSTTELGRPESQFISLVQYYMATCPDCQGFSPYFKRFISDVGPHWRHLVRVFVVNCNDDLNINLCWDQNPTLLVPLVRWYAFPKVLRSALNSNSNFSFPQEFLNVSHRQYIEGERRDHISLRRATLKYLNAVVSALGATNGTDKELFQSLPTRWHVHRSLETIPDRVEPAPFLDTLIKHTRKCILEARLANFSQIAHFIITSDFRSSPISRTVVADWSNWTCIPDVKPAVLIHRTYDVSLLGKVVSPAGDEIEFSQKRSKEEGPSLFTYKLSDDTTQKPKFTFLTSRKIILNDKKRGEKRISKRSRHSRQVSADQDYSRLGRLSQRMTLEQYYTRRKSLNSMQQHPYRYAASMAAPLSENSLLPLAAKRKRVRRHTNSTMKPKNELESFNFAPSSLYPDEELIRYHFNKAIYTRLHDAYNLTTVHAGIENEVFDRINLVTKLQLNALVSPKDEDLKRLTLTDYYKVLDEIVHKNMLSKANVDGYQILTSICMIKQLINHFPFQGRGNSAQRSGRKSISMQFLELTQTSYSSELNRQLDGQYVGCSDGLTEYSKKLSSSLAKVRVKSESLADIQKNISSKYDVGLPSESNFKWSYCAGSGAYLRGHTCSMWILFHTLTVHEHLRLPIVNATNNESLKIEDNQQQRNASSQQEPIEYKFKVKYSPENIYCDPKNPEPALVNSTSEELFVRAPRFALANIINFVRFYLSCTNCAAHFSCMVHNSDLDFKNPKPGDHLLWLWEAHNRVNVRTRKTYSEDPVHPKHVFPDYEACPACYIERPSNETEFTSMRFNRLKLIEFVVARYQKSAILNNKIRIEDLFRSLHKRDGFSAGKASKTITDCCR